MPIPAADPFLVKGNNLYVAAIHVAETQCVRATFLLFMD